MELIIKILFGGVFIAAGVIMMRKSVLYKKGAVKTMGTITNYKEEYYHSEQSKKTERRFIATVEFSAGEEKISISEQYSSRPVVGKTVNIKFDPADPRNAAVAGTFNYIVPWIFIFAGILALLLMLT